MNEGMERQVIQSYSNYTWDNSGRVSQEVKGTKLVGWQQFEPTTMGISHGFCRWLCLTPKGIVIPVLSKVVPNCLAKLVYNWRGLRLIMDISDISMV